MTTHLDVLLIERRPGLGTAAAARLESAGHRVHRCFSAPADRRDPTQQLVCDAVTEGSCPLDHGVDVAFVARSGIAVRPTVTEHGVSCSIRAGVPVVEDGSDLFDPYGPWITSRVGPDDDIASACEEAAQTGFGPLREEIRRRTHLSLLAAGIDPDEVGCRFEPDGIRLTVVLTGPPTTKAVQQALGVRVLDAIRAFKRNFGQVDVTWETSDPEPGATAR